MNKEVSIKELSPLIKSKIDEGGEVYLQVKGGSMYPFFLDGKTIVCLSKIKGRFKKNQVVLFEKNGVYGLHRIINVHDDYLTTRGDALIQKENVLKRDVIGIVTSFKTKKKEVTTNNFFYLCLVTLWRLTFALRRAKLFFLRKVVKYGQPHS
ncbi:MAG: S24/S26 family peptidase [Candidatus Izemoplasmatales bacterium]